MLLSNRSEVKIMAQTNVNIRMDENLKQQFDRLCNELGLTMSTAFNVFAKTMVRQQRIPFDVALDPFYSEENQARLLASKDRMERTGGTEHEIIEADND